MAAAAAVLTACAVTTPARIDLRPLELLLPPPPILLIGESGQWVLSGMSGGDRAPRLALSQQLGILAARIIPGDERLTAVRRLHTYVMVTPYLSWTWHIAPTPDGSHPLTLLVGFSNTVGPTILKADQATFPMGAPLPAHDRLLLVVWDRQALRRGTLEHAPKISPNAARYISRGGAENGGNWWAENLDLSALYKRAWPADRLANTKIVFLGITVAPGPADAHAHVLGIAVSR
jgi:hypothetical protein